MHVMMIDDDHGDVTLMKTLFARESPDITFSSVMDPERALQILQKQLETPQDLPQLILLDINMPRLNGFELQQQLQQEPRLRRIPVIFLSTSDSTRDIEKAYDLNANAYLTKPNTIQGLKVIVNRIHQFWLDIAKLPPPI